jgi:hypothetical protein
MAATPLCFVALAVGRDDSEACFDHLIRPVLDSHGIAHVVVNRRESNDDLNNQIIELLDRCDFCIVDLTYARPSVYFEAGYAQKRGIPVIYTVRKDHVGKTAVHDQRRVHFDRAMKPLIVWSKPTDKDFPKRLDRRLRATFLKTWTKERESEERLLAARLRFSRLPVKERLAALQLLAVRALSKGGFRSWELVGSNGHSLNAKVLSQWSPNPLRSTLRKGPQFTIVTVQALHTATKTALASLTSLSGSAPLIRQAAENPNPPRAGAVHTFVFSLEPVSAARMEAALPTYHRSQAPGRYVRHDSVPLFTYRIGRGGTLPFISTVDCVSDVRSVEEFRSVLENRIAHLSEEGPFPR